MPKLKVKSTQQAIKVGVCKGEEMFVMKVEHYSTIHAMEIIKHASDSTGVSKGMIHASWEAIGQVICDYALQGHIVEIPGLGFISAEIRAKAQKEAVDVSEKDVIRRKLMLTPKKVIKDKLNSAKLEITCYDHDGTEVGIKSNKTATANRKKRK